MDTVLVMPIVFNKLVSEQDVKEAERLAEQRNSMLSSGYTIKETRLAVFNNGIYAHYVMRKE